MYTDPDSGITASINYDACKDEEQKEAMEDFMRTLMGIPTHSELCEWVDGYEEFSNLLNTLDDVDKKIRSLCRGYKKAGISPKRPIRLVMNVGGVTVESDRDIRNNVDVIRVNFTPK